ncbi:MAG: peptidylprolyl isomerase, partial [Bacteroidetes bacterium]
MKIRLLVFINILFCFCASAQTVADKIIAKVDNHIILKSDLEMAYMSYLSSGQKVEDNLRCQILQRLVFEKMLLARAEVDSVSVDEEQVTSQLSRRMDA